MWGDQCQSCGGHENEIRFIVPCKFCSTKICNGCRANHEGVCEEMTKRKSMGVGPTVLAHHEVSPAHSIGLAPGVDFNIPPKTIQANLPAPTKVTSQIQDETVAETTQPGQIAVDIDAVNAELAAAEAEANEAALADAKAALLAATPLVEAVAGNPALAAVIDPLGLLEGMQSPLTVGDVLAGGISAADQETLATAPSLVVDAPEQGEGAKILDIPAVADAMGLEIPAPDASPAPADDDIPF